MRDTQIGNGMGRWVDWVAQRSGVSADVLGAALSLVVGWLVALILGRAFEAAMMRLGRLVLRSSNLREQELRRTNHASGRIVFWLVLAFAVMIATERLGLPVVTTWLSGVANYVPRMLVAVLVIVGGVGVARAGSAAAARAAATSGISNARRVGRLVELGVLCVAALVAIEALGIDIRFLQAAILVLVAGVLLAGALAFGLGARELVADILACHYILRLYQVGQVIRLPGADAAVIEGRLLRVVPPCVVLETADGEVALPARRITTGESMRPATSTMGGRTARAQRDGEEPEV